MPTAGRGTISTPLSPQQTLEHVTGLISEVEVPAAEPAPTLEPKEPDASPAATVPSEPAPQPSEPEPEPTEADAQEFEVKVDGEVQTVPLAELKRGYSREADYTRKTQALAREREALRSQLEAEVQASVGAKAREYEQGLAQLREALEKLQGEPNWVELHKTLEPGEFLKQKADWEASKAQLDQLRRHEGEVAEQNQRAAAEQFQRYRRQEQDKLLAAIPEWNDPEKAKSEHAKLVGAAKTYGYTEQEILNVVDSRAIRVLRDAARYQELHREPTRPSPKTSGIKPARPGTPERPRPNEQFTKKVERAKQSGRQRDAMDAIADLLD